MNRNEFAKRLSDIQKLAHDDLNGRIYTTEEVVAMCKEVSKEPFTDLDRAEIEEFVSRVINARTKPII